MKKNLLLFVLLSVLFSLVGCSGEANYTATTEFYYSNDNGVTYKSGTNEFSIDDTVYMKVIASVESNKDKLEDIKLEISIPNHENITVVFHDGQPPTVTVDNEFTTYSFQIHGSKLAQEFTFNFKIVATSPGELNTKLSFDEKVSNTYNNSSTITFLE